MKSIALSVAVLFAASMMSAEAPATATTSATTADTKTDQKAVPANSADSKVAPAKPADLPAPKTTDKKDTKKEKEKVYTIKGTTIPRPNGTFLGLEVVNTVYVLSFYDAKKKPMAPDVARATATWPNPRSVLGPNRTVLNPGGNALLGSKPVLPPYTFIVRLTLLQGEGDAAKAVENYTVQIH